MSEWQPIDTAPRDGTIVLAAQGSTIDTMFWTMSAWADGGGWVNNINRSDTYVFDPTHWMPLPEPPK